ncbi:MAG: retroviral-like aspartic protease family protein [Caldilineaceae bacterium]
MIYSYEYDTSFTPSMPVVAIKVGRSLTLPTLMLTALVDSGADSAIIPVTYLRQIGARKEKTVWMRTVTGTRSVIDIYAVSLQLGPFEFRNHFVAGGSQPAEIIIGRDILNQFIITLNGLANVVEISQ